MGPGNNILPSGDIASRSFIIRLDVSQPDPENRDFKHPDPFAWTLEHRAKIMRSIYTLLVWNPYLRIEPAKRKTRFKRWWSLCGAPVEAVAKVDFAEILRAREAEDSGVSAMAVLLGRFQATFGEDNYFTATAVEELMRSFSIGMDDVGEIGAGRSQRHALSPQGTRRCIDWTTARDGGRKTGRGRRPPSDISADAR